ncbi:MAG: SirB2 family protein [Hylemonella sp.]|nr:SirB2 family protein [Hylemonella sp.]
MDLIVHTPALRHLHMGLAVTSGALFALRGAAVLARHRWPLHPHLGRLSIIIDTGLLAAALRLLWELRLNPLITPWLQVKLAVLPLYIVMGMLALKYVRQREAKALCYIGALACYGFMVSVALTRSPWGLFGGF